MPRCRSFFYNPTTKTSVWEKPAEMVGRSDVAKMLESAQVAQWLAGYRVVNSNGLTLLRVALVFKYQLLFKTVLHHDALKGQCHEKSCSAEALV